jgi:hypothetical protein
MMRRPQPIKTEPGKSSGELVVNLPPGWELRLRRVVRELMSETLPDTRESGLSPAQREERVQRRQEKMRKAVCAYISDLVTADIVGKEVALATRSRYGRRSGSLREHVAALLREAANR